MPRSVTGSHEVRRRHGGRLCGVYVHLPFCDVKCAYCDFYSLANRHVDETFWKKYLERLNDDLHLQYKLLAEDVDRPVLASVFFGGGTPSKAPAFVFEHLIKNIRKIFPEGLGAVEISAEANPESLNEGLLEAWRSAGVNRISVGMQSLDEPVLKYLGRLYKPDAYARVLSLVRGAGFTNFSADFITGVPGQSERSTLADLDFAVGEGVTHLSLYQLTIEGGTLLKQRIESGARVQPRDSQQVMQMDAAITHLERHGFVRYEISNFAKNDRSCLHNLIYWTGRPYLGLGVSAHAFTGRRRFFHARSLEKYLAGNPPQEDQDTSPRDQLMNRLRLMRPFREATLLEMFAGQNAKVKVPDILRRAVAAGRLKNRGRVFAQTHDGLKYADSLIGELWNL